MFAPLRDLIQQVGVRRGIGWLARVIVVVIVGRTLAPPPLYVEVGPQQTVQTDHPILCVHTRLNDEVEEWKIQRTLQMVREMGATTIVEFFPWPYVENTEGQFRWDHMDTIVEHARAQGLEIIARLGMVPEWAQPSAEELGFEPSLNYLDDTHIDDFAAFVEAFTAHYRGQINTIILWNEPNLAVEWGYQPADPARYVRLLQAATPAARRGNPDITVLAGALAPTIEPPGSPYGLNDIDYLTALYEAGFAGLFDELAVHTYGLIYPPEAPPAPDVIDYRRVELLRQVMEAYGDDKPVVITETGWNDHPRWTKAVTPAQRITYTIDALDYAEQNWPWVNNVCLWVFRFPAPTQSYPDYYQLVGTDFTPRPIYYELQAWARGVSAQP